jgi:DNA-binding GntR family transcriptional regulator
MRNDIQQGRLTVAELENMLEKDLAARYGVSRDTARKARNAVLSELNSRQIPTNDK